MRSALSVPAGGTLTLDGPDLNEGTIEVAGTLTGGGILENEGAVAVSGTAWSVAGYKGPGGAPGGLSITGNAYELSFSVPSGTAPEEIWVFAPTVTEGGETLPQPTPPAGGSFEGWFTEASGGSQVTDSSALTTDRTLFAHYTEVPQTITFPTIADHTLGGPDIEPGATASSGLPVTYASQTTSVCTIACLTRASTDSSLRMMPSRTMPSWPSLLNGSSATSQTMPMSFTSFFTARMVLAFVVQRPPFVRSNIHWCFGQTRKRSPSSHPAFKSPPFRCSSTFCRAPSMVYFSVYRRCFTRRINSISRRW